MKKDWIRTAVLAFACLASTGIRGQGYGDHASLVKRINALAAANPGVCKAASLVKTAGGRDIMVLTIGTGDIDNKPGIAVAGGTEGGYLLGTEICMKLASELCSGKYRSLADEVTFYILPDVSPDANAQYSQPLIYVRKGNDRPVDNDRDFITDEDPFEDLDKDGLITFIRVEDPSGKYIQSSSDNRLMTEADLSKGQTGRYLLYPEGIDNDHDGSFNEDGPGGVNFNRNFTYNYEEFGEEAGVHPVSEPETKAVADFLFDRFNIYAVFSFGPQDNLGQAWKSSDQPRADRRITSIMKNDELLNKLLSDKYHEITGLKGAPAPAQAPGNFAEWAYYHYGRYSFVTPGWWITAEKGKNAVEAFMEYAEKNGLKDVFVPWKEISHPDFPGKKTEAGGIKPLLVQNPHADSVEVIAGRNAAFVAEMAKMHPKPEITSIKTEKAGDNVYRVSLKVLNAGVFATLSEIGDLNSFTRVMRISLGLSKNQFVESGKKVQRIRRLEGGQAEEFSWLITGSGTVKITAGASNTGFVTATVDLK